MAEESERDELFRKVCEMVIFLYVRGQIKGTKEPRSPDKPKRVQKTA